MIDTLEKANIHDIEFARALGMDEGDVERLSLHQMKNEMHNKAFKMRQDNETISQEESNVLNARLGEIIDKLIDYDYDPMNDYIIDFNSFVLENGYYNNFCW